MPEVTTITRRTIPLGRSRRAHITDVVFDNGTQFSFSGQHTDEQAKAIGIGYYEGMLAAGFTDEEICKLMPAIEVK